MPDYLIALAVGPVQGFIAAARRTRDLWFGSHVLSEVSKATARCLHETGATLIFPAPETVADLRPDSPLNVGNKIVARIATGAPVEVLKSAKCVARTRWSEMAEAARANLDSNAVRSEIWDDQVNEVLEIYGAWVKLSETPDGYHSAREQLERLLGARKMTRDFRPAAHSFDAAPGFGLPKSSLDAARETVLQKGLSRTTRRKLGLAQGEQLDCPALVKRLGGDPEQFPPVTRIALEAWLKAVPETSLAKLNEAYPKLRNARLATQVNAQRFAKLPFDGAVLFPSRIEALRRELEGDECDVRTMLDTVKGCRGELYKSFGEPTPYFVVVVADGDRMGAFIDSLDGEATHVAVTRALAGFAAKARRVVEEHRGACVYAGGDDVLGLLPIDSALACARSLRDSFAEAVARLRVADAEQPTLSVGLGLGHVLTPFGRLLDLGRRAEKLAKEGPAGTDTKKKRNALALIVGVRSGAEVEVRGTWETGIDERLQRWVEDYQSDRISDKTPYDLQETARRMDWAHGRPKRERHQLEALEIGRVLKKKRGEGGSRELSAEVRKEIESAIEAHGLETILAELRVARWLSQKVKE